MRFILKQASFRDNLVIQKLQKILVLKNQPHVRASQQSDPHIFKLWLMIRQDFMDINKTIILPTFQTEYKSLCMQGMFSSSFGRKLKPSEGHPNDFRDLVSERFPNHRLVFTD